MDPLDRILVLVLSVLVYFIPSLVARKRQHPNKQSIFLLNLFLGWTFLGWVGALVWSATTVKDP